MHAIMTLRTVGVMLAMEDDPYLSSCWQEFVEAMEEAIATLTGLDFGNYGLKDVHHQLKWLWTFGRCSAEGEQAISEEVKRAVANWTGAKKAD